jgi:hypothetical protein
VAILYRIPAQSLNLYATHPGRAGKCAFLIGLVDPSLGLAGDILLNMLGVVPVNRGPDPSQLLHCADVPM